LTLLRFNDFFLIIISIISSFNEDVKRISRFLRVSRLFISFSGPSGGISHPFTVVTNTSFASAISEVYMASSPAKIFLILVTSSRGTNIAAEVVTEELQYNDVYQDEYPSSLLG